MTTLKIGDKAPQFEAKNQIGDIVKLSDYILASLNVQFLYLILFRPFFYL